MKNKTKHQTSTSSSRAEQNKNILPTVATEVGPIASAAEDASRSLKNAPLHKARLGRVNLTVWMREDQNGTVRFSINLNRSYKTEDGYRDTTSLDQGDLANAITLLTEAQAVLPPAFLQPPA